MLNFIEYFIKWIKGRGNKKKKKKSRRAVTNAADGRLSRGGVREERPVCIV